MKSGMLATVNTFKAFSVPAENAKEIIEANVGDGGITTFDLDRVQIPAGGGLAWTVATLQGEITTPEIDGIIVCWKDTRAYWAKGFAETGGGTPPDCSSDDGITGMGCPGGECYKCPFSQWGSSETSGRGQACKQVRLVFVIRPDDLLPIVFALPPTSVKPMKRYLLRLASNSLASYDCVTTFALEKSKSTDGITYSVIAPRMKEILPPDQRERARDFVRSIKPLLLAVKSTTTDYQEFKYQEFK